VTDDEMNPRVSKAGADRAHHAFDLVDEWLFGAAMTALLSLSGEEMPAAGEALPLSRADMPLFNEDLPSWVHRVLAEPGTGLAGVSPHHLDVLRGTLAVERIAATEFNFRAREGGEYVERSQAAIAAYDTAKSGRIVEAGDQLGLVTPRPPRFTQYAETLVLGGGYMRPLLRARHALKLRDDGINLGRLSFLGSARQLISEPAERPVAEDYAPGAVDEFDLLIGAARTTFAVHATPLRFLCGCTSARGECPRWRSRTGPYDGQVRPEYTHERHVELVDAEGLPLGSVLSASTGRPPHRPNTADTLALWAESGTPYPGQRVLVVTSQYFVPFQTFDCLRLLYLPYGVDVDVVGFDDQLPDRAELPGYLLMETLSAIRSARRLLVDAVAALSRAVTDEPCHPPAGPPPAAPRGYLHRPEPAHTRGGSDDGGR
jgi:hypothetical protein